MIAYKAITLMITLATIVGTVWLYIVVPKGFFPREDTGYMLAITEAQSDISFDGMVERQRKVAEIMRADQAVLYVNSTVGVGGPNPTANQGRMLVALEAEVGARAVGRGDRADAPRDRPASPAWPCSSR